MHRDHSKWIFVFVASIFLKARPGMRRQLRGRFCRGCTQTSCVFYFMFFFFGGSTLLNINNGTDKPCCCYVPRSQFVLTVGVKGLTGKGNRGNPVPGGIGT